MRGVWESNGKSSSSPAGSTAVFRGIPYAEPPVGTLRFAAPQPRSPWEGIHDATAFGPTPQRGEQGITLIPEHAVAGDDTLSVNVWTPSPGTGSALPVVVWIHGGGFISGSPASPWYDGRAFARDGVVLVTISYRLGFTGFGWIEDGTPNRGVLDWVCALEWVQHNIRAFGGDPDRVTIAGQSAGGAAVLTLLGVPSASGLFHAGYAMSAAIANPSVEQARRHAHRLARLSSVAPTLAGFSQLSEARLLELQPRVTAPAAPRLIRDIHGLLRDGLMIGPVADGGIVPSGIEDAVTRGANARLPLVLGTTDEELRGLFSPGAVRDHLPHRVVLRALGAPSEAATQWLAAKGAAHSSDSENATQPGAMEIAGQYTTDAVFRSWVPRIAAARTATDAGPTWSYRFAWHSEDPPRAGHCIDVPFVFDRLDSDRVAGVAGTNPPQRLADAVHGALAEFAETGNPGWEADDGGLGPSRIFNVPVQDQPDAYATARALPPPEQ